jgi:putative NADPH-quinone reductase
VTEDESKSEDLQPQLVQARERQLGSRGFQEYISQVDEATQENMTSGRTTMDPTSQKVEAEPAAELEQLSPAEAVSQLK